MSTSILFMITNHHLDMPSINESTGNIGIRKYFFNPIVSLKDWLESATTCALTRGNWRGGFRFVWVSSFLVLEIVLL